MNAPLPDLLILLRQAARPEDVFGDLESLAALRQSYRRLAAVAHPDRNPGQPHESGEAFRMLGQWYAAGQRLIVQGAYGRPRIIDIVSPRHHYTGSQPPLAGDLCDLFPAAVGGEPVLLKAARAPGNNDLLQAEVKTLQQIDRALAGQPARAYYPALIECFRVQDEDGAEHQTNVLRQELDFVSLAQIHRLFPQGIDAADAAWMFNRVLAALGLCHDLGLVHGCVTLDHILVRLSDHGGMVIDWCYSVEIGASVLAISPPHAADVAPEIHARRPVSPATDLYMAARCVVHLLGGRGPVETLPTRVPRPIRDLLAACLLPSPHRRCNDAWQVMADFGTILRHLYGPPTFRPFLLPTSSSPS
jgi:serine/threonine protein kinase